MRRWTWKQWCALGVFVLLGAAVVFNAMRNRADTDAEAEPEPSVSQSAVQPSPTIDQDEVDRITEEQGESGEPETGPGDLPTGEDWFDSWRPTAEQFGMAFVDTEQSQEEWSAALTEMMTDRLAESYDSVDIRNVPKGTYRGVKLDEAESSESAVWVTITYDSFSMKVRFRHHADEWLAEEVQPL